MACPAGPPTPWTALPDSGRHDRSRQRRVFASEFCPLRVFLSNTTEVVTKADIARIKEAMATKAELANVKWDMLKVLLPTLSSLLALVTAVSKFV